jgi:hypothetical protein
MTGTVYAILSLHYLINSEQNKFKKHATLECICTLIAAFAGGWHYVNYYQQDKAIILSGAFPMAHSLFMEVKEHLFIVLILISLFLQVRIRFTHVEFNAEFQKESKGILYSIVILGLAMSALGIIVNMGFRVNQ